MLKHNLLIIYRNFLRAKSYFFINLVGLSTGLACTMLIYLWVADELNMDKFHAKDSRLYQVMENQDYIDNVMTTTSTPGLLAETLKEEIPEIEYAATTTWVNDFTLSIGENSIKAQGYHVGPDYFNIFSYKLTQGQPDQVLKDKSSIVISKSLAERLFESSDNAVGKMIELQHENSYMVSGVFEGTPANSSVQFDFVLSFEVYKEHNEWVLSWGSNGPSTYIILAEGSNAADVEKKIADFVRKRNEQSNVTLFLKPYSERYLYGRYENGKLMGGRIDYVKLFSVIAVFILFIACINFMNLSTARASRRAKEVGIKKAIGAQKRSLVTQYLSESLTMSFLSLAVAVLMVFLFLPEFNIITGKHMRIDWTNTEMILWFGGIALVTGLVAGSYPAIYLSGFRPAAVLKGEVRGSIGELWARKGLVIFQFALSVILIVSVIVIYKQIGFAQNSNIGYKKENLIRFNAEGKVSEDVSTFLTEVKKIPGVIDASSIGHSLVGRNNNTSGLTWEGKDPDALILFENMRVNYDLLETLDVELKEGRFFSREYGADSLKIIFNETGIDVMGMTDPIGKTVTLWGEYELQIIGVVKDFHFQSFHETMKPLFFILAPDRTWNVMVRIDGGSVKETIERFGSFYKEYNPGFTFDYEFLDEEYAQMYASEERVASLSSYFAGFAILISCLGLFGLAAFTAERRLKEIGIRKALGSSSSNIVLLLSGDFTRLVIISIVVGLPVSYYLLDSLFLSNFAYRIELEWWFFIVSGLLALFIAWITVASQAIRAANVNPVDCLKDE